jgi:hypothetical protein
MEDYECDCAEVGTCFTILPEDCLAEVDTKVEVTVKNRTTHWSIM